MSLSVLIPIKDFIEQIEDGFEHDDLPVVLQKIYFEYNLRRWIVDFHYNSLPAFLSPMQAIQQDADGVHFKTPTNLSGESASDTFNEAPMTSIGEERVDYIAPSSLDGPYKDYRDRYWYMDFYDGPQPISDELSPTAAGADRYDTYPDRSYVELPPSDYSLTKRIYGYNVFPRLRPPNMDTRDPFTGGGDHDTYLTDLNYNGIIPGMNQNQVHAFVEWILIHLLRGGPSITPLYLSYLQHDAPYNPYLLANNYADIFADAEIENGIGLVSREGTSNTYTLTGPRVYCDILRVLDALKIYRLVHNWETRANMFELFPESMTTNYYNTYLPGSANTFPDYFVGNFEPIVYTYGSYAGSVRRITQDECAVKIAYLTGSYSGVTWTPTGPPYTLSGAFTDTTTNRYPQLRMVISPAAQSPYACRYYGGAGVVTTIAPTACRFLGDCDILQVHQHLEFTFNRESNNTPAIAARDWIWETSWGMSVTIPSGSVMPRGAYRSYQWYYPLLNRAVIRQEVDVDTFMAHVLHEYAHAEISCEFTDMTPPTTHGLYVSNIANIDMIINTYPHFDAVADVSGVFERFRDEDTLPSAYDWQGSPISISPYVPYAPTW